MILLEVLLFLLLCALALGWASRRLGLPYPIALVVGGGLLGFIPRLPQLDFDPQFLLVLVLPPILYQAALLTSWRDFKANLRTISLLAIGLVLGGLFVSGHRYLGDPFIEVLLSLSVPYMAYVLAESVGASGVLAVVAAGLLRGRYSPAMVSAEMRILARSVWNILVFMLNSLIFILIGLQLSAVVSRLHDYTGWELAADALAISMVAILVRFGWVYFAEYLPAWLGRVFRREVAPPLPGEAFIVSWCGMRGIVSLAAALALPTEPAHANPL